MRTIKLTLTYDGTNYVGWQIQPNGLSIQEVVQNAARKMTGEEVSVIGASRTDAGVHAMGQVAHFRVKSVILCERFITGLNSMLPEDIAVVSATDEREDFHSKRDSKGKRYLYRIAVSKTRQPLLLNRFWQLDRMPDIEAMREASSYLVGEHDFSSFKAAGCASRHGVRRIDKAVIASPKVVIARNEVTKQSLGIQGIASSLSTQPVECSAPRNDTRTIDLTFEGNGFLRHMIRNIVGTLVDVGMGKIAARDVKAILKARKRQQAGRCAPACGLYLVEVFY